MFIFSGFAEKANTALNSAINCAEDMGHTYVGSEHILAGLLKDPSGVAGVILNGKKVNYANFYDVIRMNIGVGIPTNLTEKDITPKGQNIIKNALHSALQNGTKLAGTEHILMAILRESGCFANRALAKMGINAAELYSEMSRILPDNSGENRYQKQKEKLTASKLSVLEKYSRNLTLQAQSGKIDVITGRGREIDRVIRILCRRTKNNPCLLGEPGVGKTAVAEGLALRIASGEVPEILRNSEIYSLELTAMVAGAKYRGDFEERIRNVMNEVINAGNIILFIDEIHNLIGAGSAEGAVDAANILKPALARGEIKIIGATTYEEYRKNIEKDQALERRFQTVSIEQPDRAKTLEILRNLRPSYEAFHSVKISDEALLAAVDLSVRYIPDRFLPDKAIDLIDEASAGVGIDREYTSPEIKRLEKEAENAGRNKIYAVNSQNFEEAARFRDEERRLLERINEEKARLNDFARSLPVVKASHIAGCVSEWTKIPAGKLQESEKSRLRNLEKIISKTVIGQEQAVHSVACAVRRAGAGLSDPMRPMGTFLFCGPTGVGKTALAKALCEALFGDKDALIRVDMSEYSEKHSVSRLIGAPPGYQGYDDGGSLVKKIRNRPFSVVLFDEIEKAHPDIFNFLLPVLEEGILTSSDGKKADCRNCIIIMTSNAGAREINRDDKNLGFSGDENNNIGMSNVKTAVEKELKKIFPPEFLGRIDETVIFSPLTKEILSQIAKNTVREMIKRLEINGICLDVSEEVYDFIAGKAEGKIYGARQLKHIITAEIETPLSIILYGNDGIRSVSCTVKNDEISIFNNT